MSRVISGVSLALALSFTAWAFDAWGSLTWASELPTPPLPAAVIEPKITPKITQYNLQQTMCVGGYVNTIHSSAYFRGRAVQRQLCKYGYIETLPKNYEKIRPELLGVGGTPNDPRNLWPKPHISAWDAAKKEQPKFVTSRMVCAQEIALAEIQQAITANLVEAWKKLCILRVTFFVSL